MRMRLALACGPLLAVLGCTPTDPSGEQPPPPQTTTPAHAPAPETLAESTAPAREVLFSYTYTAAPSEGDDLIARFMYVRSWGASADGTTAWIAYSNTNRVPRTDDLLWGVDEIDLERGVRRSSWVQTVGEADDEARLTYGMLWPLVDDSKDLARLARIARLTDTPVLGAQVELSHDGALALHHRYGDDRSMGDWLSLRDAETGAFVRRLDGGMLASYNPAFSPDDAYVAFTATVPGQGAEGSGGYGLYVQRLEDDRRIQLDGVGHATSVWWSPDGARIWSVGQGLGDQATRHCVRHHARSGGAPTEVVCGDGLDDVRVVVSPDGGRAVMVARHGPPGQHRGVLVPIDVRAGQAGPRREYVGGAHVVGLRDDGLMLANLGGPTTQFVELERQIAPSTGDSLQGPVRWMDDGAAIVARVSPDGRGSTEVTIERIWPDRLPSAPTAPSI